jgi:hypothetical protein
MFPNVRLMIAATLASVVALICGFGMFAVFRVSHEPFVHLPAATAPLRLVADNAASSPAGFASEQPLDRRFQIGARPRTAVAANIPEAADQHRAPADTAPATAPPPADAAAPEQTFATIGEPTEQSAASMSPASDAPAATTDSAPSNDPPNVAAASRPDSASSAATDDIGTAAPSPDVATAASNQDTTSPAVTMPGTDPAPGEATQAAAGDAQKEPQPPGDPADLAVEPIEAANPADDGAHKAEAKKPRRSHVVRVRRAPRVAATQYSETQITPYATTSEQNFGASQMNFQTTQASQAQYFATRPVRIRHAQTAAKKPKEANKDPNKPPNKEPNTATGGPFVSATSR